MESPRASLPRPSRVIIDKAKENMKFKAKKPLGGKGKEQLSSSDHFGPDEILVGFRLSRALKGEILAKVLFPIQKFGMMENGRTLARVTGEYYEIGWSFLGTTERDRALARFNSTIAASVCEQYDITDRLSGWEPLGRVMPDTALTAMLQATDGDQELIEDYMIGIVNRMDTEGRGDDFIFPDLPPEVYRYWKERAERRKAAGQ
jgi:hypothetical protein